MHVNFISINPCFFTKQGHNYGYLQAVEEACMHNQWSFHALVPKKNNIEKLPDNWPKTLDCQTPKCVFETVEKKPYKGPKKLTRLKQSFLYHSSLYFSLQKLIQKNRSNVLFYEAFSAIDFSTISKVISYLPNANIQLWFILRYPSASFSYEIDQYQHWISKLKQKKITFKFLTDTELLQKELSRALQTPVNLLPIPLPDKRHQSLRKTKNNISCWWPGIVRKGKGLNIIQKMAVSKCDKPGLMTIIAAKNARLKTRNNAPRIKLLNNYISNKEYLYYLNHCEVILLPYIDPCYTMSSSNIFVEAILFGKMPFVYPNTWMAHELKKFSLSALVLDWNDPNVNNKILETYENKDVLSLLKVMQKKYSILHNVLHYSKEMKKTLQS